MAKRAKEGDSKQWGEDQEDTVKGKGKKAKQNRDPRVSQPP